MRYGIVFSATARRQIIRAQEWWDANREAAPMLLRDEVYSGRRFDWPRREPGDDE